MGWADNQICLWTWEMKGKPPTNVQMSIVLGCQLLFPLHSDLFAGTPCSNLWPGQGAAVAVTGWSVVAPEGIQRLQTCLSCRSQSSQLATHLSCFIALHTMLDEARFPWRSTIPHCRCTLSFHHICKPFPILLWDLAHSHEYNSFLVIVLIVLRCFEWARPSVPLSPRQFEPRFLQTWGISHTYGKQSAIVSAIKGYHLLKIHNQIVKQTWDIYIPMYRCVV